MFANVYYVPLIWTAAAIVIAIIAKAIFLHSAKKTLKSSGAGEEAMKEYRKGARIINGIFWPAILLIAAVVFMFNLKTVLVNETPQSVIDRSNVEHQQQRYEKSLKEEK